MSEFFGRADDIRPRLAGRLLPLALDYWSSLPAKNGIPARASIDPMAVTTLLPTTFIVMAEPGGGFRYQLAGSLVEEKYGLGTLAGKTPEEVMGPDAAENVLMPYRKVRDEGALFYREADMEWVSAPRKYTQYRVLLMPLSDDGARVNMIFGVQDFVRA